MALKPKNAMLQLPALPITEEREEFMDFSHHYFDSGLQILVPAIRSSTTRYIWDIFIENKIYKWFFYLFGFIFFFGNLVWVLERNKESIAKSYIPGVFETCWFVIVTMATVGYGDIAPHTWSGRIAASIVMMFGIAFFTIATGNLVAAMTIERLKYNIQSPRDLVGKTVGTLAGSTSVDYLKGLGAHVHTVLTINDAFAKLENKEIDAVVYDAPVVLFYEHHEGNGKTMITGPKFEEQYYGIAFPEGSVLREPVNRALLKLRQNGVYNGIYKKWFGELEQ